MPHWELFFREKITKIFAEKQHIIDIGGSLRIDPTKNNLSEPLNNWIIDLAKKVDYKILDLVDTYHPDIVGDIHDLPFDDNSIDAFICIAVLEHVQNPILGAQEMFRTLKKGGYCYVYVPFLYYYHPMKGYCQDYWRFTEDSLRYIFKDFSKIEIVNVRGAVETLLKISPFGRVTWLAYIARAIDKLFNKSHSSQTSGFNVFLVK